MKNKKLSLDKFKVNSFVTSIQDSGSGTVKGGAVTTTIGTTSNLTTITDQILKSARTDIGCCPDH